MTLCYDFQQRVMLILSAVLVVCMVAMINLVYGINGSILNNGIIAPNDPEVLCNKLNSNCHYVLENQTVKLTEELFKTCTIWKGFSVGNYQVRLHNSINCNPIIDYYVDHNWGAIGVYKGVITMHHIIAKDLEDKIK